MKYFALLTASILMSGSAHAACYSSGTDIFGNSTTRCDDGNTYKTQRNSLTGTTTMQGYNSRTGSTWSQKNTDGIMGKTQSGVDSNGNSYNCRMVFGQWQC